MKKLKIQKGSASTDVCMNTQPEAKLEADLIQQLIDNEYESVSIPDETALLSNLKRQIEAHNSLSLTEKRVQSSTESPKQRKRL